MIGHYLLTFYRTLSRHRLFAALNILGLAVGMAVFLALTIATRYEFSYDRWIPNAERTFRASGIMMMPGRPKELIAIIPGPTLPALQAEFGNQIEAGVRILPTELPVQRGELGAYEKVQFADPTFFDVFDLPLVAGERARALLDTSSIVLSQSMAEKYFGKSPPLGGVLTLTTDGTKRDYRVSGVLKDLPENTHLRLDFLARLDKAVLPERAEYLDQWNATNYVTYVRLPSAAAAGSMQKALPSLLKRRASDIESWFQLKLEPLAELHFATTQIGAFKSGVDRRFVTILQVVGLLTLILAAINYVNLSTARSVLRAREVALRKVFGGSRTALILQFLVEATALALVAGVVAVALVELLLPQLNAALGAELKLEYFGHDGLVLLVLGITLATGLLAGLYPALVISGFRPALVLAASRAPGGGRAASLLREGLVLLQFAVSIGLLIATGVVIAQADFVRRSDLGFNREGLMLVKQAGNPDVWPRREPLGAAIRRTPGVESVVLDDRYPGRGGFGRSETFTRAGLADEKAPSLSWELFNEGYLQTYQMRPVAGRPLSLANGMDDKAGLNEEGLAKRGLNVLVNASATRALGFAKPADAVGQLIRSGSGAPTRIVGVLPDIRFGSPRDKVAPIIYSRDTAPNANSPGDPTFVVRYRGDPRTVMAGLKAAWRSVVPDAPFEGVTVEKSLSQFYEPESSGSRLLTLGAIVAVLIGCLGLYGLAAFSSQRRTREIGIRKVLGASAGDVIRLLVAQFLRPVAVANLIAWPVAFFAMRSWLSAFDQRIALGPHFFLLASGLALLVALATVIFQTLRVARAEPARALRYE